jgi:hypothetical protein
MRKQDFQSEHLKQLPLRAIVAFAVRCARRVQTLSELPENHPNRDKLRDDIEAALRMAEGVASNPTAQFPESVLESLDASRRVADIPLRAERAAAAASEAAHAAATAWHLTAESSEREGDRPREMRTTDARKFLGGLSRQQADVAALNAFTAAVDAYSAIGLNNEAFVAAALRDYDKLLHLKLGHFPDAGSPIDPSSQGPLGPI